MIGGRHQCAVSPDEYVFAALSLYIDIIKCVSLFIMFASGCIAHECASVCTLSSASSHSSSA